MWGVVFGFLVGALAVLAAEAVAVVSVIYWLRRKNNPSPPAPPSPVRDLDGEQSVFFSRSKKGSVWVLEPDKVPKSTIDQSTSKAVKDQKVRKGTVEVFPTKKKAKIKDHCLILEDPEFSQEKVNIQLTGCYIVAISASDLSSRKWSKRYPVRVESKKSVIYRGSRILHLFFETSWEKEAWCKALRLASCSDSGKSEWFDKISGDFQRYVSSLHTEYPSFTKPYEPLSEAAGKNINIGTSSKVRYFLKKLAKKAAKSGNEHKISTNSSRGENRVGEMHYSVRDPSLLSGSTKTSPTEKLPNNSMQDLIQPSISTFSHSGAQQNQVSLSSDPPFNESLGVDEGTLCWNLLFSRLFFDAKGSTDIKRFITERIQRSLSNMRTPNYIGGITCTGLDLGSVPPHIRSMRVLPIDLNDVWSIEVDVEYSGGIVLDIETRLDVHEADFQSGFIDPSLESNDAEVTSDLLEGFEHYGDQLKRSCDAPGKNDDKLADDRPDGLRQSKSTSWTSTYVSRWKSIVNSIAEQVSQVPLSLSVKIASLRGTLRLHIKPPPSDQLWFGFTSMPEIDWNLDSSVGDHKIASGHIALLIGGRFKAAIQETLVLPNCEIICIPWMLAEKDDWVPRSAAPFVWIRHQDAAAAEPPADKPAPSSVAAPPDDVEKKPPPPPEPVAEAVASRGPPVASPPADEAGVSSAAEELRRPLLMGIEDFGDGHGRGGAAASGADSAGAIVPAEQQAAAGPPHEEDGKPRKMGRRARMMDLGKKMSEKLEEKRRHLEEKSRHIVEKMRENARQQQQQQPPPPPP